MPHPLASPANDNFADAIALQGQSGTVNGTNVDATSEPGEPNHTETATDPPVVGLGSSSVWYTIRANQSVVVILDTFGSDFDTVLAVYTGNRVDNLTAVVGNDDFDFPDVLQSRVTFIADAGTTYRIAIDGFGGEQGNFTLNFERSDLSPNDSFDAAIALDGRSGSVGGNNFGATAEPGEPVHAGVAGISSVWYTLRPNRSGVVTLDTLGPVIPDPTSYDTVLAVYTGDRIDSLTEVVSNDDIVPGLLQSSVAFVAQRGTTYRIAVDGFQGAQGIFTLAFEQTGQPASPNDDFDDAIAIEPAQRGRIDGNNLGGTVQPGEPAHAGFGGISSVWFTFVPDRSGVTTLDVFARAFVPTMAVYEGDSVNALDEVASGFASVAFFAEEGVTYRIAVDTDSTAPTENTFDLVFIQTGLEQQPNDDFEDAIALEGRRGSVEGNTLTATAQPDEPAHAGVGGFRSLWYTFAPSRTGIAIIDTFGSSRANEISPIFDTVLAVYTGDDLASLTEVASNDDVFRQGRVDRQSQVIFLAERGVTYHVAVDGFNGSVGQLMLNYRQTIGNTPPNDDFADGRVVRGESGVDDGFNVGATAEPGEPSHDNVSGPTSSVWWRWRAPFSGDVTFTTAGSTFDTVLAVYQGDAVSELTPIASDDDATLPDGSLILESLVTFRAQERELYHIAVDGFAGDEGSITLAFTRGEVELKPPDPVSKR